MKIGERVTLCCEVALATGALSSDCWIESTADGWVFLAPLSDRCGLLQATVAVRPHSASEALAAMLNGTRYVSRLVNSVETDVSVFTTAPSINRPCGGCGWLAVGAAALVLDPLCGDGTGHAFQSGLLAAGGIRAVADGQPVELVLNHYNERLRLTFAAHLRACRQFYDPAIFGTSWIEEIETIRAGCDNELAPKEPKLPFQFHDLRLVSIP